MSTFRHNIGSAGLLAAGLLIAGSVLAGSPVQAQGDSRRDDDDRTVSVSATGSVVADADIAYISTGVVTEAASAREALNQNTAAMAKLIEQLKGSGIQEKDIQTVSLNVEPRYTQPKGGQRPAIDGYRVLNQVRLTVRDVKRLGDVLDKAVDVGANQINSISFDVANAETLRDDARKQAIANARRRAELYAQAAGAQLGPVLRISESGGGFSPMPGERQAMMRASVPVEPGTRKLEVSVEVTYELR